MDGRVRACVDGHSVSAPLWAGVCRHGVCARTWAGRHGRRVRTQADVRGHGQVCAGMGEGVRAWAEAWAWRVGTAGGHGQVCMGTGEGVRAQADVRRLDVRVGTCTVSLRRQITFLKDCVRLWERTHCNSPFSTFRLITI